jgi:hypothetical protein
LVRFGQVWSDLVRIGSAKKQKVESRNQEKYFFFGGAWWKRQEPSMRQELVFTERSPGFVCVSCRQLAVNLPSACRQFAVRLTEMRGAATRKQKAESRKQKSGKNIFLRGPQRAC